MRGNKEADFFMHINESFICLVAAAIQHTLKEWRNGQAPEDLKEFKYETAGGGSPTDIPHPQKD